MPEMSDLSGFLSLPPELRNRVYEYALVSDTAIEFRVSRFRSRTLDTDALRMKRDQTTRKLKERLSRELEQPPLTRTCRVIRDEALPVFYGNNTFLIGDWWIHCRKWMLAWLQRLGPQKRSMLRHLIVLKKDGWLTPQRIPTAFVDLQHELRVSEHCLVLTEEMEDGPTEAKPKQILCLQLSFSEQT